MDRTDLKPGEWIQHAVEEHGDALNYLLKLKRDLRAIVSMAYRRGRYEALDAAIANHDCGAVAVLEHREDEQAEEALIRELLG
jgi:tRNA(Ile)-lysidine synthase TilS/MesJ